MKIKYALGILIAASLILGSGSTALVTAQAPAGSDLRLLSSDDQAIVLELTVDDFQVETVEHAGQTYQRLIIPGMVQTDTPGEPQVPTRGAMLGLPSVAGVSVQVLEEDHNTFSGYRLHPGPKFEITADNLDNLTDGDLQQTFALNQELYATDAFYPGQLAEIGYTGTLRDQIVAQVQLYPLQYNPVTGEVRLYRRILARITWEAPLSAADTETRGASPAYENLLRNTILNYDALERPPVIDKAPPIEAADIVATAITPTLKVGVTEDGLYQLNPGDLTGAGFDLSGVALSTMKMSNRGAEIPIHVHDEDSNNAFDGNDHILFYGTAITDVYTTKNVYWLEAGGVNGQRMDTRNGTLSGSATVPTHFPITLHAEEDTYYWQTMPNGEGQDHWFWEGRLTAPASRPYTLTLNNISTTAVTTTVRVRLKGRTVVSTDPDHHTRIHLNDNVIDDQLWDGQIIYDHEVSVPHSYPYLIDGSNVITVEAVGDTGASVDQVFVNWIEMDYWDTYVAENDELLFGAPSGDTFQFEVTDFTTHTVGVFDVTDPISVTLITSTTVVADGGGYKLQFEDTAQPETRYLALTAAQRKSPASIELDQPSSWNSTGHGADYIIITHEDFYTSTLTLASHREITSGLSVATVKVGDVYDEFNHGIFNPQAIRDFLDHAYDNWWPQPVHVLLVGDATQDYKDNLGTGTVNYVPSQIIETDLLGETPSDNWFVAASDTDILPIMFIGRLTAQTVSEVDDMVDKIIYYEQIPPGDSWNTKVLWVADDDDHPLFETTLEQLADRLPHYYTSNRVYVDDYYPPEDPTTDITNYINSGSILGTYAGHGNVDRWGTWREGDIFVRSDVTALDNTYRRLPVVTVANCLNGFFTGSKTQVSMAEEFLRPPDKGAVAVWAPTGLGYPAGHQVLMRAFYDAIFQDDQYALGEATTEAKIAAFNQYSLWAELVETFVLFGDPATPLGLPTNYPYVESTTPVNGASDVPIDQDIRIVFSKPMSPTTVILSGPGTAGLVLTPTWIVEYTVLDFVHTDFGYGQTLTFTISGQDNLGNSLEDGPVPRTWSFSTPTAPDDVTVSGLTTGVVQVDYTFTATVSPITATQPITYVWQATDQSQETHTGGDLDDTVTFNWNTPGTKTITVTATNAIGAATGTYEVTLDYAPPTSVDIVGPTTGITQTNYTFTAAVSPIIATQPITYVWQATNQSQEMHTGGGLSDTVDFTWTVTGTQVITVTTTNAGGTAPNTHVMTIQGSGNSSVFLPIILKND